MQYNYQAVLGTPFGKRNGVLLLRENDGRIKGNLHILREENDLSGSLEPNGFCMLFGSIQTSVRTVQYTASGYMCPESIQLELHDHRSVYHLTGIAVVHQEVRT
jgi:hypothetical protein